MQHFLRDERSTSSPDALELPALTLSRYTRNSEEEEAPGDLSRRNHDAGFPADISLASTNASAVPLLPHSFVTRRQPSRPKGGGGFKRIEDSPARFSLRAVPILDDLEFSGWGTVTRVTTEELHEEEVVADLRRGLADKNANSFGQWKATGIAGNAVLGSVFYAFPAVVQVAGIWSPLCLFLACMTIFLFRPIMGELAAALPYNAAVYAYLLNTTSKNIALVGGALALLDAATTATISAASFSAYLQGEVDSLPFAQYWVTIILLLGLVVLCLIGVRETVGLSFGILCLHLMTMLALTAAAVLRWGRIGSTILVDNWHAGSPKTASSILHSIFFGTCLALLSLTGFECAPMNVELIKTGAYPKMLRNKHYAAMLLNSPLMLLVFANIPLQDILSGANVLSLLGEVVAARWLRILVVVDASFVLCGGILTGFLSISSLLQRLAKDRVLPSAISRLLPLSRAPYIALCVAGILSILIYITSSTSLAIVSAMFSLVFLVDMAAFPIALLSLKFQRNKLQRSPIVSIEWVLSTLLVSAVIIAGNAALNPLILAYFVAYMAVLSTSLLVLGNFRSLLVCSLWILDHSWLLQRFRLSRRPSLWLAKRLRRIRRQPVIYFTKTDTISHLVAAIRYIQKNESTANVKLCHVYEKMEEIPSELEANHRIVDEAYPAITVDLILIQGRFSPELVASTAHKVSVPLSLVFIATPSEKLHPPLSDWGGIRIIDRLRNNRNSRSVS